MCEFNWFFFAVLSHLPFICDQLTPYLTLSVGHFFGKKMKIGNDLSQKRKIRRFCRKNLNISAPMTIFGGNDAYF